MSVTTTTTEEVVHEAAAVAPRISITLNVDKPEKHKDYYTQNGNVVIQVEKTLFKLDLTVLHAKSPVFRIIVPPVYGGRTRYTGFNDEHPFALREISTSDFERLLWVLYPLEDSTKHPTTVEDWLSVLKLSTKFQIDDIRPLAASKLHTLSIDPIRKITIWDEYHLDSKLLTSSYVALCQRIEPLTLQMTMALGLKNFTKLAAARDLYHYNLGCLRCGRKTTSKGRLSLAQAAVSSVFSPTPSPVKTQS